MSGLRFGLFRSGISAADAQRRIEGRRSGRKARNGETRHRKTHGQTARDEDDEPPQQSQRTAETETANGHPDVEQHAEKNLHHADNQRDGEELSLEIEEFHRGEPRVHVDAEETGRTAVRTRRSTRRTAWRTTPPDASCRAFGSWRASTTPSGSGSVRSRHR